MGDTNAEPRQACYRYDQERMTKVKIIGAILFLVAVFGTGYWVNSILAENKALKVEIARMDEALEDATLEINQCSSDKTLTEKASNDYQASIRSLRNQLNSLRNDPRCVPTESPGKTDGRNGAATGAELSSGNGLRSGYLLDYAGRAEETRLKLVACQSFVNNLYQSRGLNQ